MEPDFVCKLCLDLSHDTVLTPCGHSFCRACISRACSFGHKNCPLCRGGLDDFDPHAAPSDIGLATKMASVVPQSDLAQRQLKAACKLTLVINSLTEEASSKLSMWVALHGLDDKYMETIIEKVVYEIEPPNEVSSVTARVTAHPPFFTFSRHDSAPSMVRCRIHWVHMVGIRPTRVDHRIVRENTCNRTFHVVGVDRDALDTFELQMLKRVPASMMQRQLDQERPAKLPDRMAFNALGLDIPQQRTSELPVCLVPKNMCCMAKDACFLEVIVGNRHQLIGRLADGGFCHEWTMYVMVPGFQRRTLIKQVVYKLHPTLMPDTCTMNFPNFDLTCVSLEAFQVTCTIRWDPILSSQPTTLVHELIFDEEGGRTSATISVNPRRLDLFA